MKRALLFVAAVCCLVACTKSGGADLPAGKDTLKGFIYEAEEETDEIYQGEPVYNVYTLQFLTDNTGKKIAEMSSGKKTESHFSYTYNHPNITYKEGNVTKEGTVTDTKNWINFDDLQFWRISN